jgi:hypothetical protein
MSEIAPGETCADCPWFAPNKIIFYSECRRYPPQSIVQSSRYAGGQPCGEHLRSPRQKSDRLNCNRTIPAKELFPCDAAGQHEVSQLLANRAASVMGLAGTLGAAK